MPCRGEVVFSVVVPIFLVMVWILFFCHGNNAPSELGWVVKDEVACAGVPV